jgi:hypothetical protein
VVGGSLGLLVLRDIFFTPSCRMSVSVLPRRSACPSLILCQSATSGRMGTGAAILRADWLGGGRSGAC